MTVAGRGVECALVSRQDFDRFFTRDFEAWLHFVNGTVEHKLNSRLRAGMEPQEWLLVKLKPPLPGKA